MLVKTYTTQEDLQSLTPIYRRYRRHHRPHSKLRALPNYL